MLSKTTDSMKKLAIFLMVSVIGTTAMARKMKEKDVPATVKSAFENAFPKAEEVKWGMEDENYEADFELDEIDQSAILNTEGKVLETEVEIEISELPAKVKSYVNSHYQGKAIKKAEKITDAKGVVTYEAEMKKKDLVFDNEGNFLK